MESLRGENSAAGHSGNRIKLLEKRLQGDSNGASDLMKALHFDEQHSQAKNNFPLPS